MAGHRKAGGKSVQRGLKGKWVHSFGGAGVGVGEASSKLPCHVMVLGLCANLNFPWLLFFLKWSIPTTENSNGGSGRHTRNPGFLSLPSYSPERIRGKISTVPKAPTFWFLKIILK